MTVENISYNIVSGQYEFIVELFDENEGSILIKLPAGRWDKPAVINVLIRSRYEQDQVEAIINNHLLNISDWMGKKIAGEDVSFEDPEYDKFQTWRSNCKTYSELIIKAVEDLIAILES